MWFPHRHDVREHADVDEGVAEAGEEHGGVRHPHGEQPLPALARGLQGLLHRGHQRLGRALLRAAHLYAEQGASMCRYFVLVTTVMSELWNSSDEERLESSVEAN